MSSGASVRVKERKGKGWERPKKTSSFSLPKAVNIDPRKCQTIIAYNDKKIKIAPTNKDC
jgi:hypothetical protein